MARGHRHIRHIVNPEGAIRTRFYDGSTTDQVTIYETYDEAVEAAKRYASQVGSQFGYEVFKLEKKLVVMPKTNITICEV